MPEFFPQPDLTDSVGLTFGGSATYQNVWITGGATMTVDGGATFTVLGNLSIDVGATLLLNNASLTVAGMASINGTLSSNSASDAITFNGDTFLTYALAMSGGTVTVGPSGYWYVLGFPLPTISGAATFTVNGSMKFTTPLTLSSAVTFGGSGTVNIVQSTLTITAALTMATATLNVSSVLLLNAAVTLNSASITGTGSIQIPSGKTTTTTAPVTISIASITTNNSGVGYGTYEINASVTLSSGAWSLAYLLIDNGATLTVSGTSTANIVTNINLNTSGTLTVNGTFTMTPIVGGGSANLAGTGTLSGSGTFVVSNTVYVTGSSPTISVATVTIGGGATLSAAGTVTLSCAALNGTGTLDSSTGSWSLAGASSAMSWGAITITGSVSVSAITVTVAGNVTVNITAGNTFTQVAGTYFSISGSYTLTLTLLPSNAIMFSHAIAGTGTLSVGASQVASIPTGTYSINFSGAGTVDPPANGTITASGSPTWSVSVFGSATYYFTLTGSVTVTIGGSMTWYCSSVTGSITVSIGTGYTLVQRYSISWGTAAVTLQGTSTSVYSIYSGMTVTYPAATPSTLTLYAIAGAGTFTIASSANWAPSVNLALTVSTVNPAGTLTITGVTITVGASISFTGGGTGTITGTGTLSVSSTYTLTLSANFTLSGVTIGGLGTLACGTTTITLAGSITLGNTAGTLTLTGNCTITNGSASAAYTITIGAAGLDNVTWAVGLFSSSGGNLTISVTTSCNLTQSANTPAWTNSHLFLAGGGTYTIGANWTSSAAVNSWAVAVVGVATGVTVTVSATQSWGVGIGGPGALTIGSTYTLTFTGTQIWTFSGTLTVTGTMALGSGATATIGGSMTKAGTGPITGSSGTLAISNSGTLTLIAATTISVGTIQGQSLGTDSPDIDNGSGALTLGASVILNTDASNHYLWIGAGTIAAASGPITVTVSTGTVFISGTWGTNMGTTNFSVNSAFVTVGVTQGTSATTLLADPTSGTITIAAGAYWLASPVQGMSDASNTIAFGAINAGSNGANSAAGTGYAPFTALTSITVSAAGRYSFGVHYSTTYKIFMWLYINSTSAVAISLTGYFPEASSADTNGTTTYIYLVTNSVGNITAATGSVDV